LHAHKSFSEVRELKNGHAVNPLRAFSEECRVELQALKVRRDGSRDVCRFRYISRFHCAYDRAKWAVTWCFPARRCVLIVTLVVVGLLLIMADPNGNMTPAADMMNLQMH
jgi:hypothetical protein